MDSVDWAIRSIKARCVGFSDLWSFKGAYWNAYVERTPEVVSVEFVFDGGTPDAVFHYLEEIAIGEFEADPYQSFYEAVKRISARSEEQIVARSARPIDVSFFGREPGKDADWLPWGNYELRSIRPISVWRRPKHSDQIEIPRWVSEKGKIDVSASTHPVQMRVEGSRDIVKALSGRDKDVVPINPGWWVVRFDRGCLVVLSNREFRRLFREVADD